PIFLNSLPGRTYPASMGGGIIDTPRGVLITGDLVHHMDSVSWKQYEADYGVFGGKKLNFPTFEALGNHDFYVFEPDTFWVMKKMVERNKQRLPYLTSIDSTGLHYSWEWDGVHFINLNTYAGDTYKGPRSFYPLYALQFLKHDLEVNVGSSGKPVI